MKIEKIWVASKDKNHFRVFEYDLDDSILLRTFIELYQWDDFDDWRYCDISKFKQWLEDQLK